MGIHWQDPCPTFVVADLCPGGGHGCATEVQAPGLDGGVLGHAHQQGGQLAAEGEPAHSLRVAGAHQQAGQRSILQPPHTNVPKQSSPFSFQKKIRTVVLTTKLKVYTGQCNLVILPHRSKLQWEPFVKQLSNDYFTLGLCRRYHMNLGLMLNYF